MPTRPNVIVVFTDQQRWDTTGAGGNPLGLTPEFDAIAASGTYMAQAFTANPVCAPARAAIQTGQYGTSSGCFRNGTTHGQTRTLAHYFADAGYATGYIGKWHLADTEPVPPEQRGGYESWLGANLLEFTSDAYRTVMFDGDGEPVMLPGYRSDAIFDAAIRFVADHSTPPVGPAPAEQERPFYLFCSLIEPHHQNEVDTYPAPVGYAERYTGQWMPPDLAATDSTGSTAAEHMGGYLGQIRRIDEGLGRLIDALRSTGQLENTIIAFTSDHGNHFRTRNSEYKRSCHDSSIRVPFAMRGPGFEGGGRVDRPVSTIDLPPTLLNAAGIDVPEQMQGHSILPLVRDPGADFPQEAFVQVSESELGRTLRTDRWKYHVVAPDADPWIEHSADRYVEAELYDLANDPHELRNVAGVPAFAEVAEGLRDRLIARMEAAGEPAPVIESAPARESHVQPETTVYTGEWVPTRYAHQPSYSA
ncbi:sulfatase-like hydrolase/transferase [Ruania alkalisoli]|uniref:Sulfatase-like hydrolase/transferase n=1 Tax=Ruania alkalisoli TaxID=2779775 RepID=A0A7M1SQ45_9MICO|nr:sulfatase-like hydrolase/transferase [Ruania alkalisoli]QOR69561.1 sulfatase-like hydrolase/transferase [Ruania alkalisoli]